MSPITLKLTRKRDRAPKALPSPEAINSREHAEQSLLFQWADLAGNQRHELRLLFAIPNGGHRHIATAKKLKREGVKAGVPDVCLPVARGPYHALYIEMKYDKGKPSSAQNEWHEKLRSERNAVRVCWTWEQARDAILQYLDHAA